MNITQSLRKWGNGNGVRLPQQIIKAAGLAPNQLFAVSIKNGAVVLTPIKDRRQSLLAAILQGVTPELVGGELEWGPDRGAELYE